MKNKKLIESLDLQSHQITKEFLFDLADYHGKLNLIVIDRSDKTNNLLSPIEKALNAYDSLLENSFDDFDENGNRKRQIDKALKALQVLIKL